jgi:hypothetical protein
MVYERPSVIELGSFTALTRGHRGHKREHRHGHRTH